MLKKKKNYINLFYVPALILFLVIVVYPLLYGVRISFTNWNGYSQKMNFVGFENYISFFHDENVFIALKNTLIYGIGSTLIQNVLGLAYAMFLNSKFKFRSIVRTVIYLPVMIAPLIMGYIIYFFVQYDGGAINDILVLLGMEKVDLMSSGKTAVLIMTAINTLQFVGTAMIIYLAGLQNISVMYYEAADIDGASKWKQFKYITFPLIMPAIASSTVINLIGGLKLFDIIMALTSGGPGYASHSLSTLITNQYFSAQNAGYASTIGIFTFLLIMVISNIVSAYFDKKEVYM